ncbi:hypothetical protein Tco_0420897 [Tanacetum coccineum]
MSLALASFLAKRYLMAEHGQYTYAFGNIQDMTGIFKAYPRTAPIGEVTVVPGLPRAVRDGVKSSASRIGVSTGASIGSGFGLRMNLNYRRFRTSYDASLWRRQRCPFVPRLLQVGKVFSQEPGSRTVLAVTNFESMSVNFAI